MKSYLCRVRTIDGDHEYRDHFGAFGNTQEDCRKQAEATVASGFFDFDDNQTISELIDMLPMTAAEERVLRKFKCI